MTEDEVDSTAYAALVVVQRLVHAPERLQQLPESGRIVPERGEPDLRELIVRPFRIVYRVRSDVVEIVTVFRATRLFPDVSEQRAAATAPTPPVPTRPGKAFEKLDQEIERIWREDRLAA